MLSDVNRAARVTIEEQCPSRLRSILKRVWHVLVIAFSGPGLGEESGVIDDSAMPSGFMAPYRRGSRQVRNLWHLQF